MTADLELYLRGLFVNRWRCRHERVTQVFDYRDQEAKYYCAQCAAVATVTAADVRACQGSSRSRPQLVWRLA